MTQSYIEFPKLGLLFKIDSVAFKIGSINIYWYGIMIAAGFLAALITALIIAKKYGVSLETIYDIAIFGMPSAIICARLYYVVFEWESYAANPIDIFKIRNGGIAIYGAIIGAVLSTVIYCRVKKQNLPLICDIGGVGLVIGQIFGRWGNFFNQEAFGGNTNSLLGMTGNVIKESLAQMASEGMNINPDMCVHPTFLYESLWNVGVLAVLLIMFKRRKFDGQVFLTYITLYGLGRFFIEGLRTDSLYLFNFRVSQVLALVTFAAGLCIIIYNLKNGRGSVTKPAEQYEPNCEQENSGE